MTKKKKRELQEVSSTDLTDELEHAGGIAVATTEQQNE